MMAPAPQVPGPFSIQPSIGRYSETRLSPRRTFALHLGLAGATAGDEMEVERLSQCSGCRPSLPTARLTLTGTKRSLATVTAERMAVAFPRWSGRRVR